MTKTPWAPGTATAIGSMPGGDPLEAARIVVGELPALMPFPELPARGVGADMLGRTAGMLVDLAVEVVPSGYRVTARPGRDQRRAADLLSWDLDAVEQAVSEAGAGPELIKVQAAGPWTLAAGIELERGHRVLTDHGAVRDFTESLTEGLKRHVTEVASRTGARVLVQLDEPGLPAVLQGNVPTPSGYGSVPAVAEPDVQRLLADVFSEITEATGHKPVVHCCAARPPVGLLRRAGVGAISLDASRLGEVSGTVADELGETWEEGIPLFLGLVPSTQPGTEVGLREVVKPAFDLADRLGFARNVLARQSVASPVCGLSGASLGWARRALSLAKDAGRMFADADQ